VGGGTVTSAFFSLGKQTAAISFGGVNLTQVTENVSGSFGRFTLSNLSDFGGPAAALITTSIGSCTVSTLTFQGANFSVAPATPLDAGAQLTLNGPNVSNKAVPKQSTGIYNASLSTLGSSTSVLQDGGTYTLTGTGGADVAAFTASLTIPTPVTWSNQSAITTVNRSADLAITWTGGAAGQVVVITGFAGTSTSSGGATTNTATIFACLADAGPGSFSVPSPVLSQLPAASGDLTTGSVGFLSVQSGVSSKFTAPLTAGGNIDYAVFSSANGGSKNVAYQ
jgi:hypothetical protein